MPHIHYRTENADAVGTTALALEEIGDIYSSADASDILGFVLVKADTTSLTAAESLQGEFVINPRTTAPDTLRIMSSLASGGAPAAIQGHFEYPKFVPFKSITNDVADKQFTFQYDAVVPEPTSEVCAQATLVYSEGSFPVDVIKNIRHMATRISWADSASDDICATAVAMPFPDTMTVPGWVSEIVAVGITITPDAVTTATEHLVGYLEIGGTIPGLYPMQIPLPAFHASTGVVVGQSDVCYEYILPMYIDHKGNADSVLNFTTVVQQVTSGAYAITVTLYGR